MFRFKRASGARVLKDEIFHAIKPGLKAYASDPLEAASTLEPLMETAMKHVPEKLRSSTPLTLRATAGLRLLPEGPEAASALLEASKVKVGEYGFRLDDEYVSILDGMYEGAYGWIAVNYLLRKLSGSVKAPKTVAVADLGGGPRKSCTRLEIEMKSTERRKGTCYRWKDTTCTRNRSKVLASWRRERRF